jgi:D-proline reductase (dithiol) PrdB
VRGLWHSWHRVLAALYGRLPLLSTLAARRWSVGSSTIPWAPARVPLPEASIALVTSAGVHLGRDPPFDMSPDGDAGFRVIPGDARSHDLTITHDYYDHRAADRDVNCVFPLDRLRELAAAGRVGASRAGTSARWGTFSTPRSGAS